MSVRNGETDLPPGWVEAPLGDLVEILDNRRIPVNATNRALRVGAVPYYGATGQVGWIDRPIFDEELVLLGEDGAPFLELTKPKAYVIRGPSWVNNHAHVLKGTIVDNTFLAQQLNTVDFHAFVSGTTRLKLPQGPMRQIPLRVAPAKEQRRIVDALESYLTRLDAAFDGLKRVGANLKRYRASMLKDAVEGRLVPTEAELAAEEGRGYERASDLLARILKERRRRWEESELVRMKRTGRVPSNDLWKSRYEEPEEIGTNDLPSLPDGWCWATLDQIAATVRNGVSTAPREEAGVSVLRISAVRPLALDLADIRFLPGTPSDYEEFFVSSGDLLFTRYNGNPELVGACARVPDTVGRVVHPDKLIRVRVLPVVLSEFVEVAVAAGASREHLRRLTRTTAGQAGISGTDLKKMPIPLPPAAEQGRIAAAVSEMWTASKHVEAVVETSRAKTRRLGQSILTWAFEGKLVDQDQEDEPASVLLDRIRNERAVVATEAKRPARAPSRKTA